MLGTLTKIKREESAQKSSPRHPEWEVGTRTSIDYFLSFLIGEANDTKYLLYYLALGLGKAELEFSFLFSAFWYMWPCLTLTLMTFSFKFWKTERIKKEKYEWTNLCVCQRIISKAAPQYRPSLFLIVLDSLTGLDFPASDTQGSACLHTSLHKSDCSCLSY